MANCVVQFFIQANKFDDPNFNNLGVDNELLEYSLYSAKEYARQIGADYKLIEDIRINHRHPTFERFDLFYNDSWWYDYDHILYLDTDVVVWPSAPDIFEMYPNSMSFKVCDDRTAKSRTPEWHTDNEKQTILKDIEGINLQQYRFNAGVFMLNRNCVRSMKPYLKFRDVDADDNQILIKTMFDSKVPVEYMDWRFNKKNGVDCWFGHAQGQTKFKKDNKVIKKSRLVF